MELAGKVALVTGGVRRLGRALAQALAEAGADLVLHHHASSEEQAESAAVTLRELGRRVELFRADLTRPEEIDRLFVEVENTFGELDILINNAAIFQHQLVDEISFEDWDRVLDLNLRAPFFCSQRAARLMKRRGAGRIINIADIGGLQPWSGYAHHSISKAGLIMMTRVMARALAPSILVNAIAPGPVLPADDLEEQERAELAKKTALKRVGQPADIARAVIFLAQSDYITGETLVVDGGKTLLS